MPTSLNRLTLGLLLLIAAATVQAQTTTTPQAVVERLHASLLEAMQSTGGYQARYDKLAPVLGETFDFERIASIVTGRYWKTLDDSVRAHFLTTFSALSTATYASNFAAFAGERFVTVNAAESAGGTVVRTELVKTDGGKVPLNYLLQKSPSGGWRVVNVIAQGVSDLALKRAEYAAVIKAEGIDSLIKRLDAKIAGMARKS